MTSKSLSRRHVLLLTSTLLCLIFLSQVLVQNFHFEIDRRKIVTGWIVWTILKTHWILSLLVSGKLDEPRVCSGTSEPIDAVYTWVNGSDPNFLKSLRQYRPEVNNKEYEGKIKITRTQEGFERITSWDFFFKGWTPIDCAKRVYFKSKTRCN